MSIFEYDEKLHERTMREEGREEGIVGTVTILKNLNHSDKQIKESLMDIYNLTVEEAESFIRGK